MNKIEKLVAPYCDNHSGYGGASYEEVIDKINEIIDALNGKEEPELRESEDERIRKALIDLVSTVGEYYLKLDSRNKMLAWLERKKTPSVSFEPAAGFDSGSAVVYHNDESEDERIRKKKIEHYKI